MRRVPPRVRIGSCASIRWLNHGDTGPRAAALVEREVADRAGRLHQEDVELVGRDVVEGLLGHAEVLGEDVLRRVSEPVGEQDGRVLVEVSRSSKTRRSSQPSSPIPWIRVRHAPREEPEVALADVVQERLASPGDGGDPRAALQHVGPLGLPVEMELADGAPLEPHVDPGDLLGDAELAERGLPGPASLLEAHAAVGERPSQVGEGAVIGRRRHHHVRVLGFARHVPRPEDVGALPSRMGGSAASSGPLRSTRSCDMHGSCPPRESEGREAPSIAS